MIWDKWELFLCIYFSLNIFFIYVYIFYKCPHHFSWFYNFNLKLLQRSWIIFYPNVFHHSFIISLKFNILSLCDIWFTYLCFDFVLKWKWKDHKYDTLVTNFTLPSIHHWHHPYCNRKRGLKLNSLLEPIGNSKPDWNHTKQQSTSTIISTINMSLKVIHNKQQSQN